MVGTDKSMRRGTGFDASELRALQSELITLGAAARSYPLEYATGSLQLLFDSPQEIELLVESLAYDIACA
jgi:hypothetical protein